MKNLVDVSYSSLANTATPNIAGGGIGNIVSEVIKLLFPLFGLVLLAMLIAGGYQYMTSAGDPKATSKASSTITYAIVGFIVIFGAYYVVKLIGQSFSIIQIQSLF